MKALAASLKGAFTGFNLLPDVRKSSPTKLSALKGAVQLIDEPENEEERKSIITLEKGTGARDLEAQERLDSEQPFFENNPTS